MTDRITCPACEGRRGQHVGGLFLACEFCGGQGTVGGRNEPAERGDAPPPPRPPAWEHRVWSDPWIAAALGCRMCLGSRRVTHVDEEAGTLITGPCSCTQEQANDAKEPPPGP